MKKEMVLRDWYSDLEEMQRSIFSAPTIGVSKEAEKNFYCFVEDKYKELSKDYGIPSVTDILYEVVDWNATLAEQIVGIELKFDPEFMRIREMVDSCKTKEEKEQVLENLARGITEGIDYDEIYALIFNFAIDKKISIEIFGVEDYYSEEAFLNQEFYKGSRLYVSNSQNSLIKGFDTVNSIVAGLFPTSFGTTNLAIIADHKLLEAMPLGIGA